MLCREFVRKGERQFYTNGGYIREVKTDSVTTSDSKGAVAVELIIDSDE